PLLRLFKRVSATNGFDGFVVVVFFAVAVGGFGDGAFSGQRSFSGGRRLLALRDGFERGFARLRCDWWSDELFSGLMVLLFATVFFGGEIRRRGIGLRHVGRVFRKGVGRRFTR